VLGVNGYSLLNAALQSNAGMIIVKLKPWDERQDPSMHQFALQQKYQQRFNQMGEAQTVVFGAPAIPGLGAVAGFSYVLEDTQARGAEEMTAMLATLLQQANARPEVARAFSTFRADYPQIWVEIDRERAKTLGVAITDIFLTLQTQLGGNYVNDFNRFGKTYRVMVQAEADYRQTEEDLNNLFVPGAGGEMVALASLVSTRIVQGADVLYRYNTYDSATVNGVPNAEGGFSSGQAMDAMEELSSEVLLPGFKYDWTDSSYEERKSGNQAPIALGLSLVFTFLFLAALYESFSMPVAIILAVPVAVLGAFGALLIGGEPLSLYGQIGLVLLVGLAAKVAILIVEFAKSLREADAMDLQTATVEAARLRFRPVMMTGLSFVAGVFPLLIASGAGAASRVSLGLAIFGGTLASTIGGTILVPVFFKMVQSLRERFHGGRTLPPE
jgi:multidrug efflux pump subunit AcrB